MVGLPDMLPNTCEQTPGGNMADIGRRAPVGLVISMIPATVVFVLGQQPLREGLTAGVSR